MPKIGSDNDVIMRRTRERRLGPPETVVCERTILNLICSYLDVVEV